MRKIIWILTLWVGAILPFSSYAANPASVDYVDDQVLVLQNEINDLTLPTYTIGDYAQGGVIFWLDPSKEHGLVAAIVDQSTTAKWDDGSNSLIGSFANGVWMGAPNTLFIVESIGPMGTYASVVCYNYRGGSYHDWYLPSAIEAALMIEKADIISAVALENSGTAISSTTYWTSLEVDAMDAYAVDFASRTLGSTAKASMLHVRAVRAF